MLIKKQLQTIMQHTASKTLQQLNMKVKTDFYFYNRRLRDRYLIWRPTLPDDCQDALPGSPGRICTDD